jgi:hypothetical protein
MRKRLLTSALAVLLGFAAIPSQAAPNFLTGQVSELRVSELTHKIPWDTNLNRALGEAKKTGKMVLWIHMLGTIDGAT